MLPSRYSYMELKNLLISTYGLSDDQCARLFLSREPRELMDEMLHLHRTEKPNFTIRFTFKQVLPQPVHNALLAFPSTDLRQFAWEADRLMVDYDFHNIVRVSCLLQNGYYKLLRGVEKTLLNAGLEGARYKFQCTLKHKAFF